MMPTVPLSMATRIPPAADEGGRVIRVTRHVQYPADHMFLSSKEPSEIMQYARDATMARGRILYEVIDAYRGQNGVIGYIVPASILSEAIQNGRKIHGSAQHRHHLSQQERAAFADARRTVLDQFPGIDETAVRLVVERLLRSHGTHITRSNMEKAVVDYIIYMWTSYRFRVDQGESKASAMEAVKPRVRELLKTWLAPNVPTAGLYDLWRRWDLLDARMEGFHPSSALTYYAGKETMANLVGRSRAFA